MVEDQNQSDACAPLASYSERAAELRNALEQATNNQVLPDIIYHYTNDAGLMGILETGELWFTDIFFLNDPSELKHGISFALQRIQAAFSKGSEFARFAPPLRKQLSDNVHDIAQFYIGSFSSASDDLSQWRAYGDNGRGYVIEFDRQLLESAVKSDGGPHSHSFCIKYDDAALNERQSEFVDAAFDLVPTIGNNMGKLATALASDLVTVAALFKHCAYLNESEYRFIEIHAPDSDLGSRRRHKARGGKRVPYAAVDWRNKARGALRTITIGPAANEISASAFAQESLKAGGFEMGQVKIAKSPIPYRG